MNVNGYCPHCKADLDGDLVINYPLSQGKSLKEALEYARFYSGWEEFGDKNRWGRQIAIYDMKKDMTTEYKCPDCGEQWKR